MKKLLIIFILLLVPLAFSHAQDTQKVEIIVDNYSFSPDSIAVEAGKPVEITLRSIASTIPHDFTIEDTSTGLSVTHDVRGGRDSTFTFTPETSGEYRFFCSKKGFFGASHEERGMVGTLIVN